MDHSIFNPNLIWMAVIPVSDYPFDENRKLVIAREKAFIPFVTGGTTVNFDSIVPTQR